MAVIPQNSIRARMVDLPANVGATIYSWEPSAPPRRQMRSTRLWFTGQPSARNGLQDRRVDSQVRDGPLEAGMFRTGCCPLRHHRSAETTRKQKQFYAKYKKV